MTNVYLFAIATMVLFGVAPIFAKIGVGEVEPLTALTVRSAIVTIILFIVVTIKGQWAIIFEATSKSVIFLGLEGVCAALLGHLTLYYAYKFGEVSKISPIVAAFPLVAVILSIIFLGEELTLNKVIAGILIVSGVILLRH